MTLNSTTILSAMRNARPYYDDALILEIIANAAELNIPFCNECIDFHFTDELHSIL